MLHDVTQHWGVALGDAEIFCSRTDISSDFEASKSGQVRGYFTKFVSIVLHNAFNVERTWNYWMVSLVSLYCPCMLLLTRTLRFLAEILPVFGFTG